MWVSLTGFGWSRSDCDKNAHQAGSCMKRNTACTGLTPPGGHDVNGSLQLGFRQKQSACGCENVLALAGVILLGRSSLRRPMPTPRTKGLEWRCSEQQMRHPHLLSGTCWPVFRPAWLRSNMRHGSPLSMKSAHCYQDQARPRLRVF